MYSGTFSSSSSLHKAACASAAAVTVVVCRQGRSKPGLGRKKKLWRLKESKTLLPGFDQTYVVQYIDM